MKARQLFLFLVQLSLVLLSQSGYHHYRINGHLRYCTPIFDCQPGYQVQPCAVNYTKDLCQKCPKGLVQPDFTSLSNNTDSPKCFKPQEPCEAYDVEPRRTPDPTSTCNEHCKCKADKCYHGNPCHCEERKPCDVDETMNQNGECIPCSPGTSKKEKGCGPCKHIKSSSPQSTTKQFNIVTEKSTKRQAPDQLMEKGSFSPNAFLTTEKRLQEDTDKTTEHTRYTFSQRYQDTNSINEEKRDDSQTTLLTGILIALAALILVGIIFVVVLVCRPSSKQGSLDEEVPAEGDHLMGHQENGSISIVIPRMEIKNDNQEMKSNENVTKSNTSTDKSLAGGALSHPHMYPNLESGNQITSSRSNLPEEIIKIVDKQEKHLLSAAAPVMRKILDTAIVNDFPVKNPSEEKSSDSNWLSKTSGRTFNTQLSVPFDQDKGSQNQSMQKTSSLPTAISKKEVNKEQFPCDIEDGKKDLQITKYNLSMNTPTHTRNNNTSFESHANVDDILNNSASNNIDLSSQCKLDIVSFTPGHTQVTDVCAMPVAQETEQIIAVNFNRVETMTSGLGSSISDSELPLQSPMSMESNEPSKQEYDYLVSGSEGNTESIMSGGLELYNFSMVGDKRSIENQRTEPKHMVSNTYPDSGVYDSTRQH